ncbi:MAG: nuclease [Firmicutes bacterium HGW-Firmicutes-5]|nr:MAG: nuclease [Firmicutes bacterium HGW-Firmicutes-5]
MKMTGKILAITLLLLSLSFSGCAEEDVIEGLEEVQVDRVIDGDTIVVEGDIRVRLIGVDTPETVKANHVVELYGKEASAYTKDMLEGTFVYLEKDVSDVDRYGRALRYVFLEDGTLFNELLISEGYGKVVTYPPDVKYAERLMVAQVHARENNKGLWGLIIGNPNSMIYHMPNGKHYNEVTRPVFFETEEAAIAKGYRKSKD